MSSFEHSGSRAMLPRLRQPVTIITRMARSEPAVDHCRAIRSLSVTTVPVDVTISKLVAYRSYIESIMTNSFWRTVFKFVFPELSQNRIARIVWKKNIFRNRFKNVYNFIKISAFFTPILHIFTYFIHRTINVIIRLKWPLSFGLGVTTSIGFYFIPYICNRNQCCLLAIIKAQSCHFLSTK